MKTRIKGIALMLAVILTFSGGIGGSVPIRPATQTPAPPTTAPAPTTKPAETTAPPETMLPTVPTETTEPTEPIESTEATTVPPTTLPPTTAAPTTTPPTTLPPTTAAPTTVPPTTAPPATTQPPTTQPATTVPPTTQPPTVVASTTQPPTTVPPDTTEPAPEITFTAHHAFIYNCAEDDFLFTHGSLTDTIYPASITKLFSALVALKYLDPAAQVTVGDSLYTVPADSSKAWLHYGDVLTVEQLLYGILLPSGNDAARVLAAAAGRAIAKDDAISDAEATAAFVAEMNAQAGALGMTGTHFVTPDGWHDPQHYTTMADLLTLAQLCLNDPLILRITGTAEYKATLSNRTLTWKNSNMHLDEESPFYLPDCIGLKTGYTKAAGRCLLSAFLVDGEVILAGVFGCPDPNYTYIPQFQSTCYLYDLYIRP